MKDMRSAVLFLAFNFKRKGEWSFILTLFLFSFVFLTNAGAQEPLVMPEGPAESVDAVEVEMFEAVFQSSDDEPAPSPNHPPFDQIPPAPMPEPPETDKELDSSGPWGVSYPDPVSGETVSVEVSAPNRWVDEMVGPPGYDGSDGGHGDMEESDTVGETVFVNMTKVGSPERDTPRKNVKLVMRFEDAANNDHFQRCSGTMIDAETVLTAGHCIFDHNNSWGWAHEVWVYPGWDGNGGQSNPPPPIINHYGYGRAAAHMAAGAGYVNNGDMGSDVGLLGIDRAVGQLTGWFSWVHGGSCSTIMSYTHYNYSYPRQCCNPPLCTLHTGRDMYYWSGHFDSCPDNRLQIDTTGGCFNAGWGAMSGSGAYDIDNGIRYVRAVASSSDRDTYFRFCRLWEGWVNYMEDTFIPEARGSSFDLQALDMNAEPSTIPAGNRTTLLNHLATNPTNGSSSYSTWTFRVYLSSNENISVGDTLLSTQTISRSFAPMQNVRVNMLQVTIPSNTPPGDYFIGVIYDSSTDSNYGNNDTDAWDAVPIRVTAASVKRDEIIGTWSNGIFYFYPPYWNSGQTRMADKPNGASPSGDLEAGDTDGDGYADVASCWSTGLRLHNGRTRAWETVYPVAPYKVTMANVYGDARKEVIGTYASGVYYFYRTSSGWSWRQITGYPPAGDMTAGDITGDGWDEVVSGYSTGTWYWNPRTGGWAQLTSASYIPYNLACGDRNGDGREEVVGGFHTGVWSWDRGRWTRLTGSGYATTGDMEMGDFNKNGRDDLVSNWPSGMWIRYDNGSWYQAYNIAPYRVTAGDITGN